MKNLISQAQAWWSGISQREQRLVMGCGALAILGILYWGLLQPMSQRAELAQSRIQSEKQLLTWVQDKADDITALRKSSGVSYSNQPLNQLISSSARRFKVELIRMQPRNDSVQVWIKPLAFNQLVDWLRYLKEQQGIEVEFLDIDRTDQAGMIDVNRLQFKRG
ncbi:type II secretion system protein M [Vibrio parahaemolyticus]|uniref:type II secretion system protein M n=1 Tax=Vibrio parahaemolyticus TaxID=670 RepID=UPI00215D0160|nr:type II secretion system protein M [Vibrio parahaemolyticus]EHK9125834.1 type II secretion system protein M [Vibrio parahaemolyticus]EHU4888536.1 type II secretion system protein M [Vibrio parahaemolyticus]EHU5132575.1 type II secretion system protein M [Vibrio parahaemolyticus]EHV9685044.1 type II secretion system protein M [Vibrio parahaemolyticus]EJG2003254.1 type II secretion system protein M [Vibrio parahaemolyticus]